MERLMICLLPKDFKNYFKEIWSRQKNCSCPWIDRSIKTDELELFGHTSIILVKKYFTPVHPYQNTGIQPDHYCISVFATGFNTPWAELPKALSYDQLFLEFNPISFRVLRIAETNAIPLLRPVYQFGWGQKPSPMAQEILITRLEVLGFEAKMDGVDLMVSEGISGWTNRVNIVNQFNLMLTLVIA